jgi:hypothetical protein
MNFFFFFETEAKKFCLDLLIKKERIAQLIYGKPGENRSTHNNSESIKPHTHTPGKHHHANTTTQLTQCGRTDALHYKAMGREKITRTTYTPRTSQD